MADNPNDALAAMFAQYLAGGTPKMLTQVQLPGGPQFGGGGMDMGDGGMGGFETLAQGVLDYLDTKKAEGSEQAPAASPRPQQNPMQAPMTTPAPQANPMGQQQPQQPQGNGNPLQAPGGPITQSPLTQGLGIDQIRAMALAALNGDNWR